MNLSKYWTELSALVGLVLMVLTEVNKLGGIIPSGAEHWITAGIAVLTWVAVNVFHRQAVTAAKAGTLK